MNRRQYLAATCVTVTSGFAGCSSGNGESSSSDSIQIEYGLSDPKTHEEIPDEVIEHPNPEGFYWIVVEFELASGSFNAGDIMGLTQIESGGTSHFTRAVIISSPDEETLTSPEDEYMMMEGTQGKAYYRLSEDPEEPEWVIDQLRNQHGTIELTLI